MPPWKAPSIGLAGATSLDVLMADGRGPLPEVPKREPYVGSAVPALPCEAEPMPLPCARDDWSSPTPAKPVEAAKAGAGGGALPVPRCPVAPVAGLIRGIVVAWPALSRFTEPRPADAALPKPSESTESPPPTLIASPELGMLPPGGNGWRCCGCRGYWGCAWYA